MYVYITLYSVSLHAYACMCVYAYMYSICSIYIVNYLYATHVCI